MNTLKHIITFTILILFLASCGTSSNDTSATKTAVTESYATMTPELMSELFRQVNAVDVTFYNAPMSMSSTDQNVRSFLSFISPEGITERFTTKSDGAMMYIGNGDILAEVEFYLLPDGSGGYTQVSYKGEKYYHKISPNGANFLMQPINQMKAGTLQGQ